MQVFIMRHGDAVPSAPSDASRPLTPRGRAESRQMADWLQGQNVDIECVLVSPFLRAEQTLSGVKERLSLACEVKVMPELTPHGDACLISACLRTLVGEGVAAVLVISHLPLVGYLVTELCGGEMPPVFTTCAIAGISLDASGHSVFNWQVSPGNLKPAKAI